uniref:MgtE domain-containing protein n=1 Tax=Caenorhabditis tropicalis TaxID=1561998 RepID=A0A1I7UB36_9PELO
MGFTIGSCPFIARGSWSYLLQLPHPIVYFDVKGQYRTSWTTVYQFVYDCSYHSSNYSPVCLSVTCFSSVEMEN